MMELETTKLLDLSHSLAGEYLAGFRYPWEALDGIRDLILRLGAELSPEEYDQPSPQVWVHKTAQVFPSAWLGAPCIIGPETEVRHGAFIRGSALVGAGCVVGNSVELYVYSIGPGPPLQLCRGLHPGLPQPHGCGVHHLQCQVRQDPWWW